MMKDYEILITIIYSFTTLILDFPFIPPFTVNTKGVKLLWSTFIILQL